MMLRIWLSAWVRALRAEDRATRSTRIASTFPSRDLASPRASPDCAARAADTASWGSDLPPAATLTVRSVDLHDHDSFAVQVPGEPGAVAAGALDAHQLDLTERSQPSQQAAIADRGGLEGLHTKQGTAVVQRSGDVAHRGGCRHLR